MTSMDPWPYTSNRLIWVPDKQVEPLAVCQVRSKSFVNNNKLTLFVKIKLNAYGKEYSIKMQVRDWYLNLMEEEALLTLS